MNHVGLFYHGYTRLYYQDTCYFTMKHVRLRYHGCSRLYYHETC